jgi:hypothetical protein
VVSSPRETNARKADLEETSMTISPDTLRAMLAEFGGLSMTDLQLADAAGALDQWLGTFARLRDLPLDEIFPANVLRTADGGFIS